MNLDIESQDMAAQIAEDAVFREQCPEGWPVFGIEFTMIRTGEIVNRENRMLADDEFVLASACCRNVAPS